LANQASEVVVEVDLTIQVLKRHRDKNGEISKKHGNTLISTLRQTYGQGFAPGHPGHKQLREILHELDVASLSQLVKGLPPPPYV
jgi:hypothetical protein